MKTMKAFVQSPGVPGNKFRRRNSRLDWAAKHSTRVSACEHHRDEYLKKSLQLHQSGGSRRRNTQADLAHRMDSHCSLAAGRVRRSQLIRKQILMHAASQIQARVRACRMKAWWKKKSLTHPVFEIARREKYKTL
jgi:hypothetical protein